MLYGDNNLVSLDLGTDASIRGLVSKTRGENAFVGENDKSTSSSELSLNLIYLLQSLHEIIPWFRQS